MPIWLTDSSQADLVDVVLLLPIVLVNVPLCVNLRIPD